MRCDKCGKRPERYYPANQSDTPGFVRTFDAQEVASFQLRALGSIATERYPCAQPAGISTTSAELLLARMPATVDDHRASARAIDDYEKTTELLAEAQDIAETTKLDISSIEDREADARVPMTDDESS
jgi:hypothetical protein